MGWSAEAVNGVWICETLSHAEHLCIKEDLILWPPAVIVHNSTITNQNPDQRVVITLEKLEARLRGKFYEIGSVYLTQIFSSRSINIKFGMLGPLSVIFQAKELNIPHVLGI